MSKSNAKKQEDNDEKVTLCIKISERILKKIDAIKDTSRSDFVRKAILEKLFSSGESSLNEITFLKNQIKNLERRVDVLEMGTKAKTALTPPAEDELYQFCKDNKDRQIISLLLKNGYVKTSELEPILQLKRRQITNRLKRLALISNIISFVPGYKNGVKKAWWIVSKK